MSGWRTLFSPALVRDLREQQDWCDTTGRPGWADTLADGVEEAAILLTRWPLAGPEDDSGAFRTLLLRKLPFRVWYRVDEAREQVVVLRLFHFRQDQPRRKSRRRPTKRRARR